MKKKIAVLAGDGIGPEVMTQALAVLERVGEVFGHDFQIQEALVGGAAWDEFGDALPEETLQIASQSEAILFGSVGGAAWQSLPAAQQPERRALLGLRSHFDLFANLRPSLVYPQLAGHSVLKEEIVRGGFDLLIVRELTGGIYFGPRETVSKDGRKEARDTMVYDEGQIERIARVAFLAAMKRGKRLVSVDKANVLYCSVLWREVVSRLAREEFFEVELSHLYVDNAAMQLVMNPGQFDVILTGNMFGDILSDLSSVLPGSLGMIPSASLGEGSFGLYEPAGGSAPDIAGQDKANPVAQILSVALMLKHSFGLLDEAGAIEEAVFKALEDGYRTADIALLSQRMVGTKQMGEAIVQRISR